VFFRKTVLRQFFTPSIEGQRRKIFSFAYRLYRGTEALNRFLHLLTHTLVSQIPGPWDEFGRRPGDSPSDPRERNPPPPGAATLANTAAAWFLGGWFSRKSAFYRRMRTNNARFSTGPTNRSPYYERRVFHDIIRVLQINPPVNPIKPAQKCGTLRFSDLAGPANRNLSSSHENLEPPWAAWTSNATQCTIFLRQHHQERASGKFSRNERFRSAS